METLSKIQRWGDTHHPAWFDIFRVLLGLVLLTKGIQVALNLDAFSEMMSRTRLSTSVAISLLAHLLIVVHIIGGLMIAIGTNTRAACLAQVPILIVAIFFVNLPGNFLKIYSEFWLSVIVLIGLVFFIVEGNGPISVDRDVNLK